MSICFDLQQYCAEFCVEKGLTEGDAASLFECITGLLKWEYYNVDERNAEFETVKDLYSEYEQKNTGALHDV